MCERASLRGFTGIWTYCAEETEDEGDVGRSFTMKMENRQSACSVRGNIMWVKNGQKESNIEKEKELPLLMP